jgi:hypothetical protein
VIRCRWCVVRCQLCSYIGTGRVATQLIVSPDIVNTLCCLSQHIVSLPDPCH